MRVTHGLVIDGPWVSLILAGRKTWEMRSKITHQRGAIGLIRKGTGKVWGVVDIVDCGTALTVQQMLDTKEKHQIPEDMIRAGKVSDWCIPWVLEGARAFTRPIPYEHRSGAVVWVKFDEMVSDAIAEMLEGGRAGPSGEEPRPRPISQVVQTAPRPLSQILAPVAERSVPSVPRSPETTEAEMIGRTQVTEGNLKNNHLYLRGFFDRFPLDAVGGANRQSSGRRALRVRWRGSEWHETDLDGQKKFFRSRSLMRKFFEDSDVKPGDWVEVERLEPYHYVLHHKRA